MSRKLLLMTSMFLATPAFGQSVDTGLQALEVAAIANPACLMRVPATVSGVNASFADSGNGAGQINIVELVDPRTAIAKSASISLSLPVICNSAHMLRIRSQNGGLTRNAGNQRNSSNAGFAEALGYTLIADWAGQSAATTSAVREMTINANNAGAGNAIIAVSIFGGGTPLVAGKYTDTIIIEFSAAK